MFPDRKTGSSTSKPQAGATVEKVITNQQYDYRIVPAQHFIRLSKYSRRPQEKNVFVHKFIAIGTLEERIDLTLEDKKKMASAIVGADESWLTELDNESFKRLISLDRQAILG